VLARKKQDARKSASEEARKQAMWDERNRIRDEEEKAAASGVKPKSAQEKLQDPVSVAVSESKWDRLMNGGGKKKKAKRAPAAVEAAPGTLTGGSERKKPGEDGVSVRAACAHQLSRDTYMHMHMCNMCMCMCLPSRPLPAQTSPPLPSARSRSTRPTGCEPPLAWHR
tara:strand:- start:119 stop:622 length:504 start_codon:yes stop_codon:yes gene_type:complete